MFESLTNALPRSLFTSKSILNVHQSGFRPGHSTFSAASLVLNDGVNCLDRKKQCAALFIDLSKAFNTVDRSLHIQKSYLKLSWIR